MKGNHISSSASGHSIASFGVVSLPVSPFTILDQQPKNKYVLELIRGGCSIFCSGNSEKNKAGAMKNFQKYIISLLLDNNAQIRLEMIAIVSDINKVSGRKKVYDKSNIGSIH